MSKLQSHRIKGTNLAVGWHVAGNDLAIYVEKGEEAPTQVLRVILRDAAMEMTAQKLMNFSPFSPDFVFPVGDMTEGRKRVIEIASLPKSHRIKGTDLELNWNMAGKNVVLHVNKGPAQIFRVMLTAQESRDSGPVRRDCEFRVGDINEGLKRAMESAGLATLDKK